MDRRAAVHSPSKQGVVLVVKEVEELVLSYPSWGVFQNYDIPSFRCWQFVLLFNSWRPKASTQARQGEKINSGSESVEELANLEQLSVKWSAESNLNIYYTRDKLSERLNLKNKNTCLIKVVLVRIQTLESCRLGSLPPLPLEREEKTDHSNLPVPLFQNLLLGWKRKFYI